MSYRCAVTALQRENPPPPPPPPPPFQTNLLLPVFIQIVCNMAVMVYFEQPETRKCYINTCEQHIFYNMCYYKAVEYKLYQT